MATLTLYGIANCDACRKARRALESRGYNLRFHDLRHDGLDPLLLGCMVTDLGWDNLLNRRSTTWRLLPESIRTSLDRERALELMLAHPTLIKRPVVEDAGQFFLGLADFPSIP
ncbi:MULTISPECIES: arsenate reductase [Methylococcus]|uniref:Arsenate reductase n=1 Tax=Methylococcus capsulatus TaxID=414 RepID=A0ABZ2F2E5_METCP|nr:MULTISPECIES: arsenate reductase [Methylococcus]MDF9391843.1 arsenate reductase [Methylococcus capsulatus]